MKAPEDFRPILLRDAEVTALPELIKPVAGPAGEPYELVRFLIRANSRPLGTLDLDLPPEGIARAGLEQAIRDAGWEDPEYDEFDVGELPALAVVIATRDRVEPLKRCLESLRRSTYLPAEVVVVENTPRPSSARSVVTDLADRGLPVRYVWEPTPGLAHAHNSGLSVTRSTIVAFTDDDVEVDVDWGLQIARAFRRHPEAACVTGLIYPACMDTETQQKMDLIGFNKGYSERAFSAEAAPEGDPMWPFRVGVCGSGANMAFRRDYLSDAGGFDVQLGAGTRCRGGDDLASFFDVITAGHTIQYCPQAIVRHEHDKEPEAFRRRAFSYGVALGAYLTRAALREPGEFGRAIGRRIVGNPQWQHDRPNANPGPFPKPRWLLGILWGAFAYMTSVLSTFTQQFRVHLRKATVQS